MTTERQEAIARYEKLSAKIEYEETYSGVASRMVGERRRLGENTLKDWLGWFALLLVAALLLSSLIINMGRHFGWWTIDQFNDLLGGIRASLSDFGGEGGPSYWIATLIWWVIEIVTGILMLLPLQIFEFIEIFIPDAGSFMGFVDAAILAVVFGLLIKSSPISTVDRYSSYEKDVLLDERDESRGRLEKLRRERDELVRSAGIQDYVNENHNG